MMDREFILLTMIELILQVKKLRFNRSNANEPEHTEFNKVKPLSLIATNY